MKVKQRHHRGKQNHFQSSEQSPPGLPGSRCTRFQKLPVNFKQTLFSQFCFDFACMLIYYISDTYLFPVEIRRCLQAAVSYPAITAVGENITPIQNLSVLFIIRNKAFIQNFIILEIKLPILQPFKFYRFYRYIPAKTVKPVLLSTTFSCVHNLYGENVHFPPPNDFCTVVQKRKKLRPIP